MCGDWKSVAVSCAKGMSIVFAFAALTSSVLAAINHGGRGRGAAAAWRGRGVGSTHNADTKRK